MPSTERDPSRDSERPLRHRHSASVSVSSEGGRAIIPMWDSSDPERAPPPLPMNPSSPIVSRPNTSNTIQSAHAALTEKARENGYVTNPPLKRIESPERSLIKGATHKRMQSLQTSHVRDLSAYLENGSPYSPVRSPEKMFGQPLAPQLSKEFVLESRLPEKDFRFPIDLRSPERESRFMLEEKSSDKHTRFVGENGFTDRGSRLLEGSSPEKEHKYATGKPLERESFRPSTPISGREAPSRDMPTMRPSLRRPPQSILGENTPPQSATMLALQNMAVKDLDAPLTNVTNGATALVRTPQTFEAISTQILNITNIATSLQRDMANLSRRSKDNATDLVSLKEATNARDEDIRKSLRELVTGLSDSSSRASSTVYGSSSGGGLFLDNKAHNSPNATPRNIKAFSLPRIPSPGSFAASLDRETTMFSPAASYCHDGVTNIALLEKILREMSTREGQEQLAGRMLEVADRLARDGSTTAKKLDELLQLIKEHHSKAVVNQNAGGSGGGNGANRNRNFSVSSAPVLELDFDQPKPGPMTPRGLSFNKENIGPISTRVVEIVNEDIMKIIRTIKDSVTQGGGLTAEVKALVRELRGEVLGMGREIGRKLDQADTAPVRDTDEERDRVARIFQEGLDDLKDHMDSLLHDHRRQSASSLALNKIDYEEIYEAVRSAVNEKQQRSPELQKEEIIEAVKEAWENYKPEIELQQFGLEREELLTCLKEGIQEYCPPPTAPSATRDEVFTAVVEGLKHFVPPQVETEASLSRDEILDAVRECLEEFEFPSAPLPEPLDTGITRDDMLDAVNEGLHAFNFSASTTAISRNIEDVLTRDDMLDAVKEGLHNFDFPATPAPKDIVVSDLLPKELIVEAVREGLANFNFSANMTALSRDVGEGLTQDDVFEAVKEGLKSFDFASNTTALGRQVDEGLTHDDVLAAVKVGLQNFDFPSLHANRDVGAELTRDDVFDAINDSLNNFDFVATSTALTRDIGKGLTRGDVLEAVKEGLDNFDFSVTTSTALVHESRPTLSKGDVCEAVKAGLDDLLQIDGFGGQVFEKLQEIMESMRADFHAVSEEAKHNVSAHGRDTEQLLDATKDGFEKLRGDIETYVDHALDINEKDDLLESLRDSFESLRAEIELSSATNSTGGLDAVQGELEHLRETMASSLVRGSSGADKDDILEAIRTGLSAIRTEMEQPRAIPNDDSTANKDEILEALKMGFEDIRTVVEQPQSLVRGNIHDDKDEILDAIRTGLDNIRAVVEQPQSLVRGNVSDDKDEILEALRTGLENIRIDIDRSRDGRESVMSGSGEVLDALHDGLINLRIDLEKIVNKPVDMTVNYEILDILKLGMEGLRTDIDRLRESGHGEQAAPQFSDRAVVTTDSVDGLKRNDIENLEVLITQLAVKVEAFDSTPAPPPPPPATDSVSKSDLGAVENMLRDLQESITTLTARERIVDEDGVKREDVISIETLLRNTKAKIDEIDPEQAVKKEHLDLVEILVNETQRSLADMTTHLEDVSKRDDVVVVEALVRDLLGSLEEMKEKALEESQTGDKATKTDIEAVEGICLGVKAAIEQMILSDISVLATREDVNNLEVLVKEFKGRVEHQEVVIHKEFEERQAETVGVGERVNEIKSFLEEFKIALKEKLDDGTTNVLTIGTLLESLKKTVDDQGANVSDEVKDLSESMKLEFEKSNAGVVGSKLESDEKFQQTWDRFDFRLDEKFDELMAKYDDAQVSAEMKATMEDQKSRDIAAALLGTKAVAEDVRILIDTLGTTLMDSVDKMDESGKTVFNRVEDTFNRVEETHADSKAEHQLTREQVFKTMSGIENVQGELSEYHPKILESVKDILLVVAEHYEHSKSSSLTIQEKISEIPPPPELPLLQEAPPAPEKYDDASVHEKLDKLVDHLEVAGKSFAQLEMLDKIHKQVMSTAAEVSEFVSNQTQRIANDHEDKEKAVEAATIALERQLAQQEHLEAAVVNFREEEERLKESVAMLKAEQTGLAHQKMRLTADVSSLETALNIRREELHMMESRAEGLERRILEGVIDHSRALLISNTNKGRDAMSRKRVSSHAPSVAGSAVSNATSRASTTHSAVNMAMNGNRGLAPVPVKISAGASRRILSLNQISHNVPAGNFKRSHSVKASTGTGTGPLRKSSWGGLLNHKYGDLNKENLALNESEEEEEQRSESDDVSDAGTMRRSRSSHGTTVLGSTLTGTTESTIDEGTEWTGSSVSDEEDGFDDEQDDERENELEPSQLVLYGEGGQVA